MTTLEILARLVAFPTVSRDPNRALIDWVRDLLATNGIDAEVHPSPCGAKANLYARIGAAEGGVLLSGHTDVVPVDGQAWTRPPFDLTAADGRLYGRGTADMKGFVACALSAMLAASRRRLAHPLHLALTYDEELGCLGAPGLIDAMAASGARPAMCLIGEPTLMAVATGHKGKRALRAVCRGVEGHSALAPFALNALHLGADFIAAIRDLQGRIAAEGLRDGDYDVPYTTVHAGIVRGGTALNIVPNRCEVDFEIRWLAEDDPDAHVEALRAEAARICAATGRPEAGVEIGTLWGYPGLGTPPDADVVRFFNGLTGANGTIKVAYGTEGGLFASRLGVPAVVCGPGSMSEGHKPDEFVAEDQIAACERMLARLIDRLAA
jgi:acetylornithine deacetylase